MPRLVLSNSWYQYDGIVAAGTQHHLLSSIYVTSFLREVIGPSLIYHSISIKVGSMA